MGAEERRRWAWRRWLGLLFSDTMDPLQCSDGQEVNLVTGTERQSHRDKVTGDTCVLLVHLSLIQLEGMAASLDLLQLEVGSSLFS